MTRLQAERIVQVDEALKAAQYQARRANYLFEKQAERNEGIDLSEYTFVKDMHAEITAIREKYAEKFTIAKKVAE